MICVLVRTMRLGASIHTTVNLFDSYNKAFTYMKKEVEKIAQKESNIVCLWESKAEVNLGDGGIYIWEITQINNLNILPADAETDKSERNLRPFNVDYTISGYLPILAISENNAISKANELLEEGTLKAFQDNARIDSRYIEICSAWEDLHDE